MASAYGLLREQQEYIRPYDTEQLLQISSYKQQKYDQNVEVVNQAIDEIVNIKLYKQEDQQYLNARLNKVLADINIQGGGDYSNTALARNTASYIKRAVDENVLYAMDSTHRINKDLLDIQRSKEANDGTYSLANEAYTMEAIQAYGESGTLTTANSRYQSRGYIPYTDVAAKLDRLTKEFLDTRGEQVVDVENGAYIIRNKLKNLNENELREYVTRQLSPTDQRQLQIDGWYKYGQTGTDGIVAAFGNYAIGKDQVFSDEINRFEASISGLSGEAKTEAEAQLANLKNFRQNFRSQIEAIQDPGTMTYYLESENLIEGLVNKYTRNPVSSTIGKNDAYFAAANLDLQRQRLQFDRERASLNAAAKNSAGGAATDSRYYTSRVATDAPRFLDQKQAVFDSISEPLRNAEIQSKELERLILSADGDLGLSTYQNSDGKNINQIYQDSRTAAREQLVQSGIANPTESQVRVVALNNLFNDDKSDFYKLASDRTLAMAKEVQSNVDLYNSRANFYRERIGQAAAGKWSDPNQYYNQVVSGGAQVTESLYIPSLNRNLSQVLSDANIQNSEQFTAFMNDNPELFSEISAVSAVKGIVTGIDYLLSNNGTSSVVSVPNQIPGYFLTLNSPTQLDEVRIQLQPIINKMNVELNNPQPFTFDSLFETTVHGDGTVSLNVVETGNAIVDATLQRTAGDYTTQSGRTGIALFGTGASPAINTTRSGNNSPINSRLNGYYLGAGGISSDEEQIISQLYGNLPQNLQITVVPNSKDGFSLDHEELISLLTSQGVDAETNKPGAPVKPKDPVIIQLDPDDPNGIILMQRDDSRARDAKSKGKTIPNAVIARVPKSDLSPEIISRINLDSFQNNGTFVGAPIPSGEVGGYLDPSEDINVINYYENRGVSPEQINLMTYAGSLDYLSLLDRAGWLTTDLQSAVESGQLDQRQYQVLSGLQNGIAGIIGDSNGVQVGTHRSSGRLFIDITIGDYKASVPTNQLGVSAEAIEDAIRINRKIGLTTAIGSLLSLAQARDTRNSTVATNKDFQSLQSMIDAHRRLKQSKGQVYGNQ